MTSGLQRREVRALAHNLGMRVPAQAAPFIQLLQDRVASYGEPTSAELRDEPITADLRDTCFSICKVSTGIAHSGRTSNSD